MAQKQKLKSERGRLNEGIKDMFMTMEPELFRCAVKSLAKQRDTNKPGFNLVLDLFEEFKNKDKSTSEEEKESKFLEYILPLLYTHLGIEEKAKNEEDYEEINIHCPFVRPGARIRPGYTQCERHCKGLQR